MARASLVLAASALGFGALWSAAPREPAFLHPPEAAPAPATPAWPDASYALEFRPRAIPREFPPRRVVIDAGHGAEGNTGNLSSWCEDEQDFTLSVARHLESSLRSTGRFEVRLTRQDTRVPYAQRVEAAAAWKAEAFVSIHSDVRGQPQPWTPRQGLSCLRADQAPGFAVLVSDEGPESVQHKRLSLACKVAASLEASGFPPYPGEEYTASYEPVEGHAGVFFDRHALEKRIFVLRKTAMPAVLVETHNALYPAEALRWKEEETLTAFDAAVVEALVGFFNE